MFVSQTSIRHGAETFICAQLARAGDAVVQFGTYRAQIDDFTI
jgi:hypothetical protein